MLSRYLRTGAKAFKCLEGERLINLMASKAAVASQDATGLFVCMYVWQRRRSKWLIVYMCVQTLAEVIKILYFWVKCSKPDNISKMQSECYRSNKTG